LLRENVIHSLCENALDIKPLVSSLWTSNMLPIRHPEYPERCALMWSLWLRRPTEMNDNATTSQGQRPLKAAAAIAITPCVILLVAGFTRSTPWGLDGWLLLQAGVFAAVVIGIKFGSRGVALASGASAVVAGWSVVRILSGLVLISACLGLLRLIADSAEMALSVRPDRYAMILEGLWILWCLYGAAFVVEQDAAIRERERPVVAAKAQDRRQGCKIDRVKDMVERLSGDTPPQRQCLDRVRRDLQTVELALAHSFGGGLGTVENPRSSDGASHEAARIDSLVKQVEVAAEGIASSESVGDPQMDDLGKLVRELLEAAEAQEAF
jgi:hypothetical protein